MRSDASGRVVTAQLSISFGAASTIASTTSVRSERDAAAAVAADTSVSASQREKAREEVAALTAQESSAAADRAAIADLQFHFADGFVYVIGRDHITRSTTWVVISLTGSTGFSLNGAYQHLFRAQRSGTSLNPKYGQGDVALAPVPGSEIWPWHGGCALWECGPTREDLLRHCMESGKRPPKFEFDADRRIHYFREGARGDVAAVLALTVRGSSAASYTAERVRTARGRAIAAGMTAPAATAWALEFQEVLGVITKAFYVDAIVDDVRQRKILPLQF